jgi:membrane protease YdiL (CAAX protease family)
VSRPVLLVCGLEVAYLVGLLACSAVLGALAPDLPGYSVSGPSQSLVLVLVSAGLLLGLAVRNRWSFAGFTPQRAWRNLHLYWLPVLLLAVPFAGGIRPLAGGDVLLLLVVAYAATAVFEEGFWRGVIFGILRPSGVWQAVLISSLLFGLGHLGNSALRGASPLIAAQAFGAGVSGVGLAALRLHTNTIWPLIAVHFLHDLFLQMSVLPIPLVEVVVDTILLIYGVLLVRSASR